MSKITTYVLSIFCSITLFHSIALCQADAWVTAPEQAAYLIPANFLQNSHGQLGIGTRFPFVNDAIQIHHIPGLISAPSPRFSPFPALKIAIGDNETDHYRSLELALAHCNSCYSNIADMWDAVLKTTSGDLILGSDKCVNDPFLPTDLKAAYPEGGAVRFFTRVDRAQPQKERMTILNDGKVLIGITSITSPTVLHQNLKLAVNGAIFAKEVLVRLDGWSDFVLDGNYKLLPLDKLEQSIKEDKHLPGIPSTEEVLKDGVLIGDMQSKLLQKIEELTLYVIALNKQNETLAK